MKTAAESNKKILTLLQTSLYMESIILMVQTSFLLNKTDVLKKIDDFGMDFLKNISEEEKSKFNSDLKTVFETRIEGFKKELEKEYSKEQVKDILKNLVGK